MPPLSRGLYEVLLTKALQKHLRNPELAGDPHLAELRSAEAGDRIALHLASVVERAIAGLPDEDRIRVGVDVARQIIELVATATNAKALNAEQPVDPGQILLAVRDRRPDGKPVEIKGP